MIPEKESEADEAAAEYAGGSMTGLIYYQKLATLTEERVYELLEYFN